MAFAAGEQGRHAALLHALCNREKQAVGSTVLLQTRVSEAALGGARLHARVASCLHGVSRPYSCCQANVGRFWRRSQRSSGQRASCHVHRTLLHRRNVIMCSVRGRWPPQAGRVKIIDFSKTTLLSCSQRADHGTLRGSASFALVHEKVWSKVNWLLDQVNLYGISTKTKISNADKTHARTGPDTQRAQAHNHTQTSNSRTHPRQTSR